MTPPANNGAPMSSLANASDMRVWHQDITLQFFYPDVPTASKWASRAKTTLYMTSPDLTTRLALHLRRTCEIKAVRVEILENNELKTVSCSYQFVDPLANVLVNPYSEDTAATTSKNSFGKQRYAADAHHSRGASGFMSSLRAASITSNLGELQIALSTEETIKGNKNGNSVDCESKVNSWKTDLTKYNASCESHARLEFVAEKMATSPNAFKVTIDYAVIGSGGGIQFGSDTSTPLIYTTCGTFGDSEGPRHWLPCLDSASLQHRASRRICIIVTAAMRHGVSVLGNGERFGVSETFLHQLCEGSLPQNDSPQQVFPQDHVIFLRGYAAARQESLQAQEGSSSLMYATVVWSNHHWTPAPARSLGFAIGPFRIIKDMRYEFEDDEQGVRQAYLCPMFARRYIHAEAALVLMGSRLELPPLAPQYQAQLDALDQTIQMATTGVPHLALTFACDVLQLVSHRSSSYTQIWIPNAVHGGNTSGALHTLCQSNTFLGGAILDSLLLPPVHKKLPYYTGGRNLQLVQASSAIGGWVKLALPLGDEDHVGNGYIHELVTSVLMSLYERAYGSFGQGGAKGGMFCSGRFASESNLDLNVTNMEESEAMLETADHDRYGYYLWRTAANGSESHTGTFDEFQVRQCFLGDIVETIERGDKDVPLPSFGWTGSHLSLSFLSSTASSSTELGCGAVELAHPVGGLLYRCLKAQLLARITEARAGLANLIRVIRAGFIAGHLGDLGETRLQWQEKRKRRDSLSSEARDDDPKSFHRPPFVVCVDKLLSKGGFTHALFTSGLRLIAGSAREVHLRGTLVEVERNVRSISSNRQIDEPEGFPNSYVRGSSLPYLRVGVHVESTGIESTIKGTQLHVFVEPAIPDGGIAFGGPVTLRVVENEGQLREFVKILKHGARADWGPIFLHAKPVTTAKEQLNASGVIEVSASSKENKDKKDRPASRTDSEDNENEKSVLASVAGGQVFDENLLHRGGFQAIELARLTNRSPLLWIRVDPLGHYGGKISIFQPDACLAEQLFHDGDAAAQVDAIRALAERPLRIQGSVKVKAVHHVQISELPVRVLGDCLRGSPALYGDLPHTPIIRAQAALGIAQWQNNKAPSSKDSVDTEAWLGVNLLMQYFKERHYRNGTIMPVRFSRITVRKSRQSGVVELNTAATKSGCENDDYVYLDSAKDRKERQRLVLEAEDIEVEEDEEYRVRSSVITALAGVRAKDGMTPPLVMKFLSAVLDTGDLSMGYVLDAQEAESLATRMDETKGFQDQRASDSEIADWHLGKACKLSYVSVGLIADTLLALCAVNSDQLSALEPLIAASRQWLEWELYRETIRTEMDGECQSGVGGNCYSSVAACGIAALSSLSVLCQTTLDPSPSTPKTANDVDTSGTQYYIDIFEDRPRRPDVTRAACLQAVACVCCAADRFESQDPALGLLTALELILYKGILDTLTSPSLRQTMALIMLDACTGKVSSMQRTAVLGARADLLVSGARFYGGPLGASSGNDNGSAMLNTVNATYNPVANAVNDGARRGLKLLGRAGHPKDESNDEVIVRVAKFATDLWRTINGHVVKIEDSLYCSGDGVCANDSILRCSLLALWQIIWPKACFAILRVQSWRPHEGTPRYEALGAHRVAQVYDDRELELATMEQESLQPLSKIVDKEIDRQAWRGEMFTKAYENIMDQKKSDDATDLLLPPILRDSAFKLGGWVTSTAQQRRAMHLDGGMAVTKIRLTVKGSD